MTANPRKPAPAPPQRWARLRPEKYRGYPAVYHLKWFKVLDAHHDPSVTTAEGYIWLDTDWKIQSMWAAHFEIQDRKPEETERSLSRDPPQCTCD